MQKLNVNLKHCYGIKKLEHEFDFSTCNTVVVYAPNGVMKTSFAKTFHDIAIGNKPCDQMDDLLIPTYDIFVDGGAQIQPEGICVIEPYNEQAFNSEDKILTLLADEEARKEYLAIYNEIESLKKATIAGLKKISGSSNYESEVIETFSYLGKKNIFEVFDTIIGDIKASKDSFEFKYNHVFDPNGKVKDFLSKNYSLLEQYIEKYNDLIGKSTFFARDTDHIFGTTEARNLGESLDGDEYFIAGHKLVLKSHGDISYKKELVEIINEEISKIFSDKGLREIFEKIEKALSANKELKAFKKVIEKDNSILLRLSDYDVFRRAVWFSFLKKIETGLESLIDLYNQKKVDLEKIIQKAKDGQSEWEGVILEFENRFVDMPFSVDIKNKSDAVLNETTPALDFKFQGRNIERKNLIENILSQGERRAFYLLNVIFELKSRRLQSRETLFIIDDIADSFDYKNKYAIVEYLNDLSKEQDFYSIILTHNFDFYRTITSRLSIPRKNRLHAVKTTDEIKLITEVYQNTPFKTWRECMKACSYYDKQYTGDDAKRHIIALIPFVRNLIEYSGREDISSTQHGTDCDALTALLHSKDNTKTVSFGDLRLIFDKHLGASDFDGSIDDQGLVYDAIIDIADKVSDVEFNLENKIILSVAIRHKAEEHMWSKVSDTNPIPGSQTGKLFQRYKDEFKSVQSYVDAIKTLESVNIMTPENIHLNSFMYEPILDMGMVELKNLYGKVCDL